MVKKLFIIIGILLLAAAGYFGWLKFHDVFTEKPSGQTSRTDDSPSQREPTEQQSIPDGFNKTKYSLTEAGSPWWVVNKTRPLTPSSYQPENLVFPDVKLRVPGNESMKISASIADDIKLMFAAASKENIQLMFSSGFRSYGYQTTLYNSYVAKDGKTAADTYSARPGYSEHQTGLAFDVCNAADCELEESFAASDGGKWVSANAHMYGFIIRYPADKSAVTGYQFEPWHLRYVGVELATEMRNKNIQILEEFFGLPAAPDYL